MAEHSAKLQLLILQLIIYFYVKCAWSNKIHNTNALESNLSSPVDFKEINTEKKEKEKPGKQKDREAERQRDRKTEREKDRETERQKTEMQIDRETERQRYRKTE
jgi:hypothetical protein